MTAVLAVVLMFAGAPTAQAAQGHIYGVVPDWGGWSCPWPNHLGTASYFNNTVPHGNGGDSGYDIVCIPVALNIVNDLTMAIECPPFGGTVAGVHYRITPTRNEQTFWFRTDGHSKHN